MTAPPAVSPDGVIDNSELLRLAGQALQANRLYAPAGDNAVEFYLAARMRRPDDAAIQAALTEIQPYLLIATEQALERRDGAEAARLFELLRRLDPQAPALPRLQAGLTALPATPEPIGSTQAAADAGARRPPPDAAPAAMPVASVPAPTPRPVASEIANAAMASPPPAPTSTLPPPEPPVRWRRPRFPRHPRPRARPRPLPRRDCCRTRNRAIRCRRCAIGWKARWTWRS